MGDPIIKLLKDVDDMISDMLRECDYCYLCDCHPNECKCEARIRDVKAWYKKLKKLL